MDLNNLNGRYFPVFIPKLSQEQVGWSLVERGKITIVINSPPSIQQFEAWVESDNLTAVHLAAVLKGVPIAEETPTPLTRTYLETRPQS